MLLVTLDRQTHEMVGAILERGAGEHRLYWASDPMLAVGRAQELSPHLILVDGALPGESPISLITNLVTRAPTALVLALVEPDAMDQVREATLAGARGFFTMPLRESDVIPTLRQLLGRGRESETRPATQERRLGKVLLCCAPKGGTGRTMMAVNTSISLLQQSDESVVLVDADYASPALDVALNLQPERSIVDLLPRLSRLDEELMSSVLVPHVSGLQVLLSPAPGELEQPIGLPQVQRVLAQLRQMFDWVIVDLGLPLDETAYAFLDSADRILISVLPEMVGLRNIRLMLDQFALRGYPSEKIWLVLNRATIRGGVELDEIEKRLEFPVIQQVPDDQVLATTSVNRGIPIILSQPRSAVGRAYQRLARRVMDATPRENGAVSAEQVEMDGLLQRLRRRMWTTGSA